VCVGAGLTNHDQLGNFAQDREEQMMNQSLDGRLKMWIMHAKRND
jgi:hypothetical protein